MFRNVFGSIGISASTALVEQRSQIRQSYLSQWLSPLHQPYDTLVARYQRTLEAMGHDRRGGPWDRGRQGLSEFTTQVAVLAYSDVFRLFGVVAFIAVPLCFLLSGKTRAAT